MLRLEIVMTACAVMFATMLPLDLLRLFTRFVRDGG